MSTLSIENVYSGYQGQQVLKGLNLHVQQGEIIALLGASGCGKTTLLRAIAGLHPISQGKISINGRLLSGHHCCVPSEERGVGMIFQDYALFPHLSVADNILFGVKGLSRAECNKRLSEMLALVKLDGLENRYPHELSGGQQQRVSIARALAYEPELLLLDEPFSNIDAKVRHEMMLEIRSILKQRNVSAIFVTHSKDEAFVFADKLALFNRGHIEQYGEPEQLYRTPSNKYVAAFLGDVNFVPAKVQGEYGVQTALGAVTSSQAVPQSASCVELLLRPEQLLLAKDDNGLGVIHGRHFLGNSCHYDVKIGADSFVVKSSNTDFVIGQKVGITVSPHCLVLLEK